jgi:hypothetical protein
MQLSNLIAHWSAHLRRRSNDTSLAFDQDGMLSLLVEKHRIDCRVAPEAMILRARICGMPTASSEHHPWLCRILMLTNTHAHSRREFPVLNAQGVLQLHAWINAHADYEEFCAAFDEFMEALDAWRQTLLPSASRQTPAWIRRGEKPFSNTSPEISQGTL